MPKLKWLLTVKIIRIVDGFKSLDINSFMKIIRKQLNRYTNWRIQRNPILADDINLDQINITFQMKLNYCLKTFKSVFLMLNVNFLVSILWILFCQVNEHFSSVNSEENFLSTFEMDYRKSELKNLEIITKTMYYSFTTLTTVGFGDMRPINNGERLVCAFIMFFGISLFSLVMGTFLEIINRFKKIDVELGE